MAKGIPTLRMKLVEKIWNLEYVDMEEFLPTPHSLRMAEQGSTSSFQESLVGAFSQYQALQQHKSQQQVVDIGKEGRVSAAFTTRHRKAVRSARSVFSPTAVQALVPSTSTAEPPTPMPPSLGARVAKDSQALNRSCVSEKSLQNKPLNIC